MLYAEAEGIVIPQFQIVPGSSAEKLVIVTIKPFHEMSQPSWVVLTVSVLQLTHDSMKSLDLSGIPSQRVICIAPVRHD